MAFSPPRTISVIFSVESTAVVQFIATGKNDRTKREEVHPTPSEGGLNKTEFVFSLLSDPLVLRAHTLTTEPKRKKKKKKRRRKLTCIISHWKFMVVFINLSISIDSL